MSISSHIITFNRELRLESHPALSKRREDVKASSPLFGFYPTLQKIYQLHGYIPVCRILYTFIVPSVSLNMVQAAAGYVRPVASFDKDVEIL